LKLRLQAFHADPPLRRRFAGTLLAACVAWAPAGAQEGWKAVEAVQTYSVAGMSGPELYASIGERGPKAGIARVIAQTTFKLTWSRTYEKREGACVLVSAVPKLVITTTLPKPSQRLPPAIAENWKAFIAGVRAHERVHGEHIEDLVREIELATVGLTVAADPECRKIKDEMNGRLSRLSLAQRERSRAFDRVEMRDGGNVHRLILNLVNGG
jgi:predicted secreted Zn-dependent protease